MSIYSAGHFTQMICDRVTEVGCAIVKYTQNSWKTFLITCNYSSANILGYKIYSAGQTATKCETGKNEIYAGLCSERENRNPNILNSKDTSFLVIFNK